METLARHDWDRWDRFVRDDPHGSFFHTTAWMESVRNAFHHRPIYLMAFRGRRMVAGLPLFEVHSLLGGKLLVSVPYAIYGGPIGNDAEAHRWLQTSAYDLAERGGVQCITLRCDRARWTGVPVSNRYVTFRGSLPDRAEDCLGALPRKARAAARSARERHHLTVSIDDRHLPAVWRMYCTSMRRLGSLNYPFRFFRELMDRTPKGHIVSLVSHNGRPVAGLVTFLFNGVALPYFVGADPRFNRMNVFNYVYLTAMEHAVRLGCRGFDFGRSRRENAGACAFKKHQGFRAEPLQYQTYTPPGRVPPDLTPTNPRFSLARRVWPRLPAAMTRPLGAWLTRHIPG